MGAVCLHLFTRSFFFSFLFIFIRLTLPLKWILHNKSITRCRQLHTHCSGGSRISHKLSENFKKVRKEWDATKAPLIRQRIEESYHG